MAKENAVYEALHAGDCADGDHHGLKDMDVEMDSSFPATFGEEDMNQQVQPAAVMTGTGGVGHDREIYNLLEDVNDVDDNAAMFYNDFPPLPDFPCMSSSSSSSSVPLSSKPAASTSSSSSSSSPSANSWAIFKRDTEYYCNNSEEKRHHHNNGHIQRQQYDDQAEAAALSSTASMEINLPLPQDDSNATNGDARCIDVLENFGYMDLLDGSDIWDPSSIFENENPQQQNEDGFFQDRQPPSGEQQHQNQQQSQFQEEGGDDGLYFLQGNSELAVIFLDWLKQNKDYISAQEMRSIKLKRATIDCALKRLGTSREGKKQLLKLILEWVGQYQLQKKRAREIGAVTDSPYDHYPPPPPSDQTINPNLNADLNCNPVPPDPSNCFSPSSSWTQPPPPAPPPPPCVPDSGAIMAAAYPHTIGVPGGGYVCDIPYSGAPDPSLNGNLYASTSADQYQPPPVGSTQSWNIVPPPFAMGSHCQYNPFPDASTTNIAMSHSHAEAGYGSPYLYPVFDSSTGERLVRLGSSATKEARKKRMARQRRISVHQFRHHHQHQHHNHHQNQPQEVLMSEQQMHVAAAAGVVEDSSPSQANPAGNWIYWSPAAPPPVTTAMALVPTAVEPSCHAQTQPPVDRGTVQQQNQQQQRSQLAADRKQGLKTEKNLKFLLQKVLKQSDVGNLGRIVLPKKEAETHLPELESRDGISIAMEDIGTSNVWNMRYRFWPNNKSRMYLLENTGDFVRINGLQEGDFIVIYSDTKCGKYLIRGVKVRQPGSKPEAKKPSKKNQRNSQQAATKFSPASFKQTVK